MFVDIYTENCRQKETKFVLLLRSDTFGSHSYLEEIRQLYYRDEFSHHVQLWNNERGKALEAAFEKILYPGFAKELRAKLIEEAKVSITRVRFCRFSVLHLRRNNQESFVVLVNHAVSKVG